MKLLLSSLLLTLPSSTLCFAPVYLAKTRSTQQELAMWPFRRKKKKQEPKAEGGFTNSIMGDQEDDEARQNEKKELIGRFAKGKTQNNVVEKSMREAKIDWEAKDDGIFRCIPTKEMTGVEPLTTQLCSTISHQLYTKSSTDEFMLSTKDIKTELMIYDSHGAFFDATPPFCVAITGKTMILGWRGTSGLADGLNDLAASPQSSLAWRKHCNTIKAQGSMTSIVHNDIATHEKAIIEKAKELGITEIVTTGQSLGGGCAQIAHLTLRAQIEDKLSPWNKLEGAVNVRSVAFCGPMTTVLLDNATPETDVFVEKLWNNSCNVVYKNDVVPRGYGYLSFIKDFMDDAADDLAKAIPVPGILKRMADVEGKIEDMVDNMSENEALAGLFGVFSQYRQIGNLIFYEAEDAEPQVLKDMGAYHKNTSGAKNIFRSIKYKPEKGDITVEIMKWHMQPINGPGISFPNKELMK